MLMDETLNVADHVGLCYQMARRFLNYQQGLGRNLDHLYDDAVSEAMLTMVRVAPSFDPNHGTKFSTYVCRVILRDLNKWADKTMRDQARAFHSLDTMMSDPDTEISSLLVDYRGVRDLENERQSHDVCEDIRFLKSFVKRLPKFERALFNMLEIDLKTPEEVAAHFDITVSAVNDYRQSARTKVRLLSRDEVLSLKQIARKVNRPVNVVRYALRKAKPAWRSGTRRFYWARVLRRFA